MIKKSALQPRLAEIGKIKIGGKGEKREKKGKAGQFYQLPTRFGKFIVTTTERDQSGNYKPDPNVMEQLEGNPRELPIRLLFDDIEMNLQTEFAMYHGKKKVCCGDGEKASRFMYRDNKFDDSPTPIDCGATNCAEYKNKQCKVSARLFCAIPYSMELGGVHVFRTHSINSVMAMVGALEFFKQNTNGILQGLPLKLKMVKKQTEEHGEIDFVTIVLDGIEMLEMRKSAVLEMETRKQLGVSMGTFEKEARAGNLLVDDDTPEDVEQEFYALDADGEKEQSEKQKPEYLGNSLKDKLAPKQKIDTTEDSPIEEMTEAEARELEESSELGPHALELAEIVKKEEYQSAIQSLLKSEEFLPGALRSKDEKVAGPIVKLIEKTKGFEDAEKRDLEQSENHDDHF